MLLISVLLLLLGQKEWLTTENSETLLPVEVVAPASIVATNVTAPVLENKIKPALPMPLPVNKKPVITPPISKTVVIKKTVVTADTNVWNKIVKNFSLDHRANSPRVQAEIRKLLSEKGKFNKILQDATPFINYIYLQTKAKGLPAEIALLPFIESEFNPNDHSNVGALGLWQLMPSTARLLHVKVNGYYDGRKNLISSTNAALLFFKDLGNNFKGNWLLAIAAYNCGPGRVEQAVRRAGTKNFWQLQVPLETKYYVPRLLAVAEIISHPNRYHIKLPVVASKAYFSQTTVKKSASLPEVAKRRGVQLATLTRLNPDYKQKIIPKGTAILIPNATTTQSL